MAKQTIKIKHPHITTDKKICNNSPIIKGTRITVRTIVLYNNDGLSPEEILIAFPHLKLVEIYDALAFYYDNKQLIDKEIEENNDIEYLKSQVLKDDR